jgi:hypothetical protein
LSDLYGWDVVPDLSYPAPGPILVVSVISDIDPIARKSNK